MKTATRGSEQSLKSPGVTACPICAPVLPMNVMMPLFSMVSLLSRVTTRARAHGLS